MVVNITVNVWMNIQADISARKGKCWYKCIGNMIFANHLNSKWLASLVWFNFSLLKNMGKHQLGKSLKIPWDVKFPMGIVKSQLTFTMILTFYVSIAYNCFAIITYSHKVKLWEITLIGIFPNNVMEKIIVDIL